MKITEWILPWNAKRTIETLREEVRLLSETISSESMSVSDISRKKDEEINRLNLVIENTKKQIKAHKKALANTAVWIRTAHRIDNKPPNETIRSLIMEM